MKEDALLAMINLCGWSYPTGRDLILLNKYEDDIGISGFIQSLVSNAGCIAEMRVIMHDLPDWKAHLGSRIAQVIIRPPIDFYERDRQEQADFEDFCLACTGNPKMEVEEKPSNAFAKQWPIKCILINIKAGDPKQDPGLVNYSTAIAKVRLEQMWRYKK